MPVPRLTTGRSYPRDGNSPSA